VKSEHSIRRGFVERISNESKKPGRNAMGLATATKSFECAIDGGLAHIVLNQPDRGNPIDGEFCRESLFGTRKADFIVGLWDGRKMAIECKVSNSATNSIKRLNNDTAVKATTWLKEFGTNQVVPATVITGVFKLNKLKQAQGSGLSLFWAEQLDVMLDWIKSTRP